MPLRTCVTLTLCAWWTLTAGSLAAAQPTGTARATIAGQEVTFGPPLAIWDLEDNHVAFAFFAAPPPPDAHARARQAGFWDLEANGPAIVVEIDFARGAETVLAKDVEHCRVRAHGFQQPLELEGRATDCHLETIGGLMRRGVGVMGAVLGEGPGYALLLPFSSTLVETESGETATPAPASASPLPMGTVTGTAAFDGQQVRVSHGLAWRQPGRGELRVALFDREPPAGILADLRAGSWGGGGPVVTLHVELAEDAPLTIASVGYCYVNVSFPRGGPMGITTDARGCGLTEFDGDRSPDGRVVASLKGQSLGPGDRPYTWDLRFHLPVAR